MTEIRKKNNKGYWLVVFFVQLILLGGVSIWAITQKVEGEKQKVLAHYAKEDAKKLQREVYRIKSDIMALNRISNAENENSYMIKNEIETLKQLSEAFKIEALKYRDLYEKCQNRKK